VSEQATDARRTAPRGVQAAGLRADTPPVGSCGGGPEARASAWAEAAFSVGGLIWAVVHTVYKRVTSRERESREAEVRGKHTT
jgi:hypothetical protein